MLQVGVDERCRLCRSFVKDGLMNETTPRNLLDAYSPLREGSGAGLQLFLPDSVQAGTICGRAGADLYATDESIFRDQSGASAAEWSCNQAVSAGLR